MTDTDSIVFIVDDDDSLRRSLERLLRVTGHNVEAFSSASAFLQRPDPDVPCCLVLDIRMPNLTGLDVQRAINEAGRPMPIILMTGFADYKGDPVLLVGHVKGGDTKEKIFRNFGYARPEGYRKAMRAMRLAEKFSRPVVVFVDTPAAYPGIESEERGVAEAIAVNLRDMMMLDTPIVVIVSGEGGSGGALGIAVGDKVLMQEYAIYSVIPPEGCAAILWRDPAKKVEAAEALKITAPDLLKAGIIDEIIPEPIGGAHTDAAAAAQLVDDVLTRLLTEVMAMDTKARLAARYAKFRSMGRLGIDFVEG